MPKICKIKRICSQTNAATATLTLGAGDGAQTHDLRLGKPTLYQLSYTRDAIEPRTEQQPIHSPIATISQHFQVCAT